MAGRAKVILTDYVWESLDILGHANADGVA